MDVIVDGDVMIDDSGDNVNGSSVRRASKTSSDDVCHSN